MLELKSESLGPMFVSNIDTVGRMKMSNEAYHAHEAIGSTSIKAMSQSPAHFKYFRDNPKEPTPAMILGTAAHEALLEPELFEANYIVAPEFTGFTKDGKPSTQSADAKAKKAAWYAENANKKIITLEQKEQISGMIKAVHSNSTAKKLLNLGHAEESYFWRDKATGILCKCRPDFLREGKIIVDLKTTGDASMEEFSRSINDFGYHISAPWYLDGTSHVTGDKYDTFIMIAVEQTALHGVAIYYLDPAAISYGREVCRRNLEIYAACLETGIWPGYDEHIQTINIPSWGFK